MGESVSVNGTGFYAVVMGAGTGTRLLPVTAIRGKALSPTDGYGILDRVQCELLKPNGYTRQTVTTWYRERQIIEHLRDLRTTERAKGLTVDHFSLGTGRNDLIGNAGGVYLAYRQAHLGNSSIRQLIGFDDTPLRELAEFWLKNPKGKADADIYDPAVEAIRKLHPFPSTGPLPHVAVVGCDCLAKVDMRKSLEVFLQTRDSIGTLGNLTLAPFNDYDAIQNYGLVQVDGPTISRFVEKPVNSKKERGDGYEKWVKGLKSDEYGQWLVNAQIIILDPAALALMETYLDVAGTSKNPDFPDMSMHVFKVLASAGKLSYRVMQRGKGREYWNDVGDLLTYREATTEHVLSIGYGDFVIPHEEKLTEFGGLIYRGANGEISTGVKAEGHVFLAGSVSGKSHVKNTVIEAGASVVGSTLKDCLVLPGAQIAPGWNIENSIIGYGVNLGSPELFGTDRISDRVLVPGYSADCPVLETRIPGTIQGEDRNQEAKSPRPLGHR